MVYLRSLLYAIGVWITTPIFSLIAMATFPLHPITRYRVISQWAKMMLRWLNFTCGVKYQVIGRENIPNHPCIILSKHQSAWETMAFQAIFPPQVWVLKRELLRVPFFGWGLAMTSPIAINRAAGRDALKQMLDQGLDRLKMGFWIVIFPEGTRVPFGERGKYHIGGAWLANHAKATVVPVAHNAGAIWGKNSFLKRAGTITVSIGAPIEPSKIKADALNLQVETWIEDEISRLPPPN